MPLLTKIPTRHPYVPERRTPLSVEQIALQYQRGLYTAQRGVRYPIPLDKVGKPKIFLNREMWRQDQEGRVYRPGVKFKAREFRLQRNVLHWLRDHVNRDIPYWYYMATLGHDLHVSTYGNLFARHWHVGWANPFNPEQLDPPLDPTFETSPEANILKRLFLVGFIEDLGWLSGGLVTDAFVSEEISELVSSVGSEYADFDFHEVGTNSTSEVNSQTALQTSSGIARATGTPTDSDPIYQNIGTITADAAETWEEHGLFNNSAGAAMMDRSLTGGQSVTSSDQVEYNYQLTKNAE